MVQSRVRCEGCGCVREVDLPWWVEKCTCGEVYWKVMDPIVMPGSKGMITGVRVHPAREIRLRLPPDQGPNPQKTEDE